MKAGQTGKHSDSRRPFQTNVVVVRKQLVIECDQPESIQQSQMCSNINQKHSVKQQTCHG